MPRRRPAVRLASLLTGAALAVGGLLVPAQAWAAPPSAPATPTLTTDQQSLTATWVTPTGGAAVTGYLVRALDTQGNQVAFSQVGAGANSHTFSGLDNGSYTATVTALSDDGPSPVSAASTAQSVAISTLARWSLSGLTSTAAGATVPDSSGNNRNATIRNTGATTVTAPGGDGLYLNGGANNTGAYVELPTGLLNGEDTVTISARLKNDTGSGNYAAAFFGTTENLPTRYFLLNPANPAGRLKSVITDGAVSTTAPYNTERGFTPTTASRGVLGPVTTNQWALYTTVITPTSITAYLDGVKIGAVAHTTPLSSFGTNLVGYLGRSSYPDATYRGGVRDVRVYDVALTDATVAALAADEVVQRDRAALSVPTTAITDIALPTTGAGGSQVRWTSSNPAVISATGVVTRSATSDTTVTLTAEVSQGGKQATRTFTVLVPSDNPQADVVRVADGFSVAITEVHSDISLRTAVDGVTVSWASSAPTVLSSTGAVTRPASDTPVTLTATFTRGTASTTRTYTVVVAAADSGRIGTYNRTGNENRTDALHLAYARGTSTTYTALNNGRPVLFGPNPETRLGSPTAFRKPDGSFGIVAAVRPAATTAWVWDSADLITFTNPRRVTLNTQGLTTGAVQVSYDNGIAAYRLRFVSGTTTYEVRTAEFLTVTAPVAVTASPAPAAGTFPAGALETSSIGVTADELATLERKLTRSVNNGTRPVADVAVEQGGTPTLPTSVTATYTNGGSDTRLPVSWDAGDVAAIDTATPGTYTVSGTARATSYPDTIGEKRADPDVTLADDGMYYMTASFPDAPGSPGYDKINLRRSSTIAGLATAQESTVWNEASSPTLNRYIWAPELAKVGNGYYIFFTAARSGGVFDIRPAILKHTGGDLLDPANWVEQGPMLAAPGDSAFSSFSLDMTHFEHAGKDYVVWAEKPGPSELRIATVDPANPRQLTSPSRVIATPDTAWEVNLSAGQRVDEGAAVIERNGRMLLTFSGSTVDDRYAVGLLSADADADLLAPASWRKTSYPLLTTADLPGDPDPADGVRAGQSGPGHNSFTTDELGNDVFVYHSRDLASTTDGGLSDPSRWARARTVHYDADGDPVLNMTPEEELRPEHSAVSVDVVVTSAPVVAPSAPGTPAVSGVTDTGATLTWTAPVTTGGATVTAYRVTVRQGETTVSTTTVTSLSTTLTGLTSGQTYTVAVEAQNSAGFGPAVTSTPFTTATLPAPALRYPLASDLQEVIADRDATAVGAVTFDDGLTLPGNSSSATGFVRLPDNLLAGRGEDLTVSVWVKSDTAPRNGAALSFGTPPVNALPTNYWLLNPAGPNGNARSVMTNGVDVAAPYATEVQVAGPSTTARRGAWAHYTTVFTAGTLTSYVDGVRVGTVAKTRTFAQFAAAGTLEGYLGRSGYVNDPAFKGSFRDLQVFSSALTPAQIGLVEAQDGFVLDGARDRLRLGDTSAVETDLALPTTLADGVTVSWATSDATVVTATGDVTVAGTNRTAVLTATLSREGRTATKTFEITVVGRSTIVSRAADLLVAPGVIASGDALPIVQAEGVTTTWSTTTPGLTVAGAVVTATTRTTGTVTATVTTDGGTPVTKSFAVTVLPATDARYVLGYTRTPTADAQVYSANVAHALHLALGTSRTGLTALNENTGVLYTQGVPSGTEEITDIRTMVTPHLFRTSDGSWGLTAVRTLSGGTPDASADTSMLLFTSPDLITWIERGTVELDSSGAGVRSPQVAWDSARGRYVVTWRSAAGTSYVSFTTDLTDSADYSDPVLGSLVTRADQATTTATGAVPGNTVVVDSAAAKALTTRFGRIVNTGSSVAPVTLTQGNAFTPADSRAALTYDDGSTATRAVDWDAGDLAAVDTATPGTYTIDGTVRQTDYAFPFITGRADPSVIRWKGQYLFMATDAGESRFDLRRSPTLAGLRTATDNTILTQRSGLAGPLWAPEMHEIDGDLWVFFASGVDRRNWDQVQAHVMKLTGTDPTLASSWSTPELVEAKGGGRLQLDAAHPGISLDMTYFTDTRDGRSVSYVAWSQRYTSPRLADAQMWIATIDPADPTRLTSDPVVFNAPDLGWDHNTSGVVEAPYVVRHGDRLVMTYSGSNIDNTYAIGQLSAPVGANLLDPSVWTKEKAPVLFSDTARNQTGPGHSMFTVDEDGNEVLVYHARTNAGGSRDTGLRRIHWAADGSLVLDMTKDEEVAPAHRAVSTTVTVTAAQVDPPIEPPVDPPVVTPPVVAPPAVVPPVVLPPVLGPPMPATPALTGKIRGGKPAVGKRTKLIVTTSVRTGRVTVKISGAKYRARVRDGRAVLTVRFTKPGKQKVVLTTAGARKVLQVRVRR